MGTGPFLPPLGGRLSEQMRNGTTRPESDESLSTVDCDKGADTRWQMATADSTAANPCLWNGGLPGQIWFSCKNVVELLHELG